MASVSATHFTHTLMKPKYRSIFPSLSAIICCFSAPVAHSEPVQFIWENGVKGDWLNANNWSDNVVPGASNTAYISGDDSYYHFYEAEDNSPSVSILSATASVGELVLATAYNYGGGVLVLEEGGELTVNGDVTIGTNYTGGSIVFRGGKLIADKIIGDGYLYFEQDDTLTISSRLVGPDILQLGTGTTILTGENNKVGYEDEYGNFLYSPRIWVDGGKLIINNSYQALYDLDVGTYGGVGAIVEINNGSKVGTEYTSGSGISLVVGETGEGGYSANNILRLKGASVLNNSYCSYPIIGYNASGNRMEVLEGSTSLQDGMMIGKYAEGGDRGDNNIVLVSGAGSKLVGLDLDTDIAMDEVIVGGQGSYNELQVLDGGFVLTEDLIIGEGYDDVEYGRGNKLILNDLNSKVTASDLTLGFSGSDNMLDVRYGALLETESAVLGNNQAADEIVEHVEWLAPWGELYEWDSVTPGQSASDGNIALVTTGGKWVNSGSMIVGRGGSNNQLLVENLEGIGGTLEIGDELIIGYDAESRGNSVVINGASSSLSAREVKVGYFGEGTLTLSSVATINVDGVIDIAEQAGSAGTLNFGAFGVSTSVAPDTIVANSIVFGNGTGSINFNHGVFSSAANVNVDIRGTKNGSVRQLGTGTTNLNGANSYLGSTTVEKGTLNLNGTHIVTSKTDSRYTVNGGTLGGTGTTNSDVLVNAGGRIRPGNGRAAGTLTIGDLGLLGEFNVVLGGSRSSLLATTNVIMGAISSTVSFKEIAGQPLTEDLYPILTHSGARLGTFVTETDVPADYVIDYGDSDSHVVFLKKKALADIAAVTVLNKGNAIITGGTLAFDVFAYNGNTADVDFTATAGTNTTGSIGTTTVAADDDVLASGMSFNGTTVGLAQKGDYTVNVTGVPTPQTLEVEVDVYDHAQQNVTGSKTLNFKPVHVGYKDSVLSSNTLSVSNGLPGDLRVALGSRNGSLAPTLSLETVSALAVGETQKLNGTLEVGRSVGRFSEDVVVTFFDDSTLNGASDNLGTETVTLSGLVYSGKAEWTKSGGGDWTSFDNWDDGGTPGLDDELSVEDSATFGKLGTGPVTLNRNAELRDIIFDNKDSSYALGGSGTIKLGGFDEQPATITNLAGDHSIDNNIEALDQLVITGASDTVLTVTGGITGDGSILITGNGTTILTAENAYTGGTRIAGGRVEANSISALGTGKVDFDGGIISIGGARRIDMLETGAYTQGEDATLEFVAASLIEFDRLAVNGAAKLDGILDVAAIDGHRFNYGDRYTFMGATDGITGTFVSNGGTYSQNDIKLPDPNLRGRFVVSPDKKQGTLLIAPRSYVPMAVTGNQAKVAGALDNFIPEVGNDRDVVSTALDGLRAGEFPAAFEAIMPDLYAAIPTIAFNVSNSVNSALFQRLWLMREADAAEDAVSAPAATGSKAGLADSKSGLDAAQGPVAPAPKAGWAGFVEGNGVFADANSTSDIRDHESESGGITAGMTRELGEDLTAGAYLGYQRLDADYGVKDSIDDDAIRFGVFGTKSYGDLYFNGLLGASVHDYSTQRNIAFADIDRDASASPSAMELNAAISTGYDLHFGAATLGAVTSLQYSQLNMDSFDENGADSLNVRVDSFDESSLLYTLGLQSSYRWELSRNLVVKPMVHASWQHEFLHDSSSFNSAFFSGGPSAPFNYTADVPQSDYLFTGAGVGVHFGQNWDASLFYNAAVGNEDYSSQSVFLTIGTKF